MEVKPKKLPLHTLPIGLLLIVLTIISVVMVYGSGATGGLTSRTLSIHPGANGLVKVSRVKPTPLSLSEAGDGAALSLSLSR